MNYSKHYNLLCEKAENRILSKYFERHHIVPLCIGGEDCSANIVNLTPEEHYVAHQLLVKMYPESTGLIWAALQMSGHPNGKRCNNKIYGWLKRRWSKNCKERKGKNNGSYGKKWYYHPATLKNIKCPPEEVPEGYKKGRINTWNPKKSTKCEICGENTGNKRRRYCHKHREEARRTRTLSDKTRQKMRNRMKKVFNNPKTNPTYGKRWIHSTAKKKSKVIPKNDPLPPNWREGRKLKF